MNKGECAIYVTCERWLGLLGIVSALFIYSLSAGATTFNIFIDTAGFSGANATLAFDFIDGGPPSNTVSLSALTSNGTQGATSTTGSVSGSGPWTFADASFFNELLVSFGPLGTSISFSFTTTDNPPGSGSVADAFSFFILDSSGSFPLITTDAPDGSDALFEFDITGLGVQGLNVFHPDQSGFSIRVVPVSSVPEPGSLALLAAAFGALLARRRLRGNRRMP